MTKIQAQLIGILRLESFDVHPSWQIIDTRTSTTIIHFRYGVGLRRGGEMDTRLQRGIMISRRSA